MSGGGVNGWWFFILLLCFLQGWFWMSFLSDILLLFDFDFGTIGRVGMVFDVIVVGMFAFV